MTGSAALREFLKQKQLEEQDLKKSKKDIVNDWQERVSQLLSLFEKWLEPMVKENLVAIERNTIEMTEDPLGTYEIKVMDVTAGSARVNIVPIARYVVGASGRVDLVRGHNKTMLILTEDNKWVFAYRDDGLQTEPLTEDSFSEAMMELLQ